MIVVSTLALATVAGIYVCHRFGPDWNYLFGTLYFAGIPFAGLADAGLETALGGFVLGGSMLIFFALLPLFFNLWNGDLSWESVV